MNSPQQRVILATRFTRMLQVINFVTLFLVSLGFAAFIMVKNDLDPQIGHLYELDSSLTTTIDALPLIVPTKLIFLNDNNQNITLVAAYPSYSYVINCTNSTIIIPTNSGFTCYFYANTLNNTQNKIQLKYGIFTGGFINIYSNKY